MKAPGERLGLPELHSHALCYSCGAELLRRTRGNLRAVQAHLRHADIQTATVYTRLTQADLERVVSVFDNPGTRPFFRCQGTILPSPPTVWL